jgi:hypothetical protein
LVDRKYWVKIEPLIPGQSKSEYSDSVSRKIFDDGRTIAQQAHNHIEAIPNPNRETKGLALMILQDTKKWIPKKEAHGHKREKIFLKESIEKSIGMSNAKGTLFAKRQF